MNLSLRRRHAEEPAELELHEDVEEPTEDSTTVRALRAQIRALEQALEATPEALLAPDDAAYRRRVLLAMRAVAARVDDHDDPRHAAARVVAAVERLDAAGFHRPQLPGIASRAVAPPPQLSTPTSQPPALGAAPEVEPGEEVVLPVPPPAAEEPRRGRRRPRHTTAA